MPGQVDEWLEQIKECTYLQEGDLKKLCEIVKELLMEEANVQPVSTPTTVCGDLHGQFYDVLELFRVAGGFPDEVNYVFLDDFVDRGFFSLETFTCPGFNVLGVGPHQIAETPFVRYLCGSIIRI